MGPSVQGVYSALGTAGLPVAAAAKFPHLGLPWLVTGHSSGFMFGILPYVVTAAATLGCFLSPGYPVLCLALCYSATLFLEASEYFFLSLLGKLLLILQVSMPTPAWLSFV